MSLLFVYGTLRLGSTHPMAAFLAQRATHRGSARAEGRLYNLGRYPGMVEASGVGEWVVGDVYELPEDGGQTLAELDVYENVESPRPSFFERQPAEVHLDSGEMKHAWIYWFRGSVREEQRIVSGDWLQRNR